MRYQMKFLLVIIAILAGCTEKAIPPVAEIIPDTLKIHGKEIIDNYSWLKDKSRTDQNVLDYINAENNYTEVFSDNSNQKNIYNELISRVDENDLSVPYRKDYYYYYSKEVKGKQYSIYCRKKGSLEAEEEIILDPNILAEGKEFFSVGDFAISPNHRYLAYSVDFNGLETYSLFIKDLRTKIIIDSNITAMSGVTWANDNSTIFYTTEDQSGRSDKLFRHVVGEDSSTDKLLFYEKDKAFYTWTYRSKSGEYIFLSAGSKTTSEIWYIKADEPKSDFKIFFQRVQDEIYYVQHHPSGFFIETNKDNSFNFKVMRTALDQTNQKFWKEYIPHNKNVKISTTLFKDFIVIKERENAITNFRIINFETNKSSYIPFDEDVYSVYSGANENFDTALFRYTYESLIMPYSINTYNAYTEEKTILKQEQVRGGYSPYSYVSERIYATANDGTKIPVSLIYNKKFFSGNGNNPLLLEAYGAYGDSFDPYFSKSRLTLLDRGVIYAIAHIRGGGELGEKWYDGGKMFHKKNTFTDFITCAEHLIICKYTNPEKLAIEGGSAGGLLIGAVTNMRPELFKSVIADVPFVDITNSMLDPSLSAVVSEYEEWGNPNIKEQFDYIYSYDPYQNVEKKGYPNLLILGGFYDTRVNYWEPAKWAAKLRANKKDKNLLLLQINMNAGHSGASGRYDYYDEIALKYAFIIKTLKVMF